MNPRKGLQPFIHNPSVIGDRTPTLRWLLIGAEAIGERCKAFAAAHRSDEDCQAYIYASRHATSVIAKAGAWQATCSSLSPKSNPKSVYSLLRSVACSSFSSSPSSNFPNYSSPMESALVFTDHLRFHFSVLQPKILRSRTRGCLSELCRAMCPQESHSSFCSLFSAEFLTPATNLSSFSATGPDKVFHAKASSSLWHGFCTRHF